MKISKFLALSCLAGLSTFAVPGELCAGEYVPVDGFFEAGLPASWSVRENFEPAKITTVDRRYPVALTDTNDVAAVIAVLTSEFGKYYAPEQILPLMSILTPIVIGDAEARAELGMPTREVVGDASSPEVEKSLSGFFAYKSDTLSKAGSDSVKYTGNPETDKTNFQLFTIGDMIDMLSQMQLPVERKTVEIIAQVGKRALVMHNAYIPVQPGDQFEISGRLFSRTNPTEEEVAKRAGLPSTLDVEQQVLRKRIGGFTVIFYNQDRQPIYEMVKLFVTEDYQRQRVSWQFEVPAPHGLQTAYIRIGLVVAPANAAAPESDPIEFSDVRLKLVAAAADAVK
ncbi:MAG: hypothetical protein PHI85_01575 [Victivallaceae bacterium]|nr:hypothetical protein [Victivallaceae bacterium]